MKKNEGSDVMRDEKNETEKVIFNFMDQISFLATFAVVAKMYAYPRSSWGAFSTDDYGN